MQRGSSRAPGGTRRARRYGVALVLLAALGVAQVSDSMLDAAPVLAPVRTSSQVVAQPARSGDDAAPTGDTGVASTLPRFTHRSARLEDVVRQPVALRIDALGVAAAVAPVGSDPAGNMEVPGDAAVVAWYEAGSVPGAAGSAVLAGHVDYDGRRGVFFDLDQLRAGDPVLVELDDGTTLTFDVVRQAQYDKSALPSTRLFTRTGAPVLTLITCGGDFDRSTRHYVANTVVQATLRS